MSEGLIVAGIIMLVFAIRGEINKININKININKIIKRIEILECKHTWEYCCFVETGFRDNYPFMTTHHKRICCKCKKEEEIERQQYIKAKKEILEGEIIERQHQLLNL